MKDTTSARAALDPTPAGPLETQLSSTSPAYRVEPAADSASWESPLPRDHPAWQRDMLVVSARVRAILTSLQPVAIRVRTFWDHAVRTLIVRGRRIEVGPSGCYRVR